MNGGNYMDFKEYQKLASRTYKKENNCEEQLLEGVMGVAGEAGEVVEELKKALFQGHTLKPTKIIKEIGDVLWYCALVCDSVGVDLEYAAKININKLKERYPTPEGFRTIDSLNRGD